MASVAVVGWGAHHHVTSPAAAADSLDALLRAGASVNIYMFHGGTNFGLTSGANDKGTYAPVTTSYDYDAPLDEADRPTAKYWAFRDVLARYAPVPADRHGFCLGRYWSRGPQQTVPQH